MSGEPMLLVAEIGSFFVGGVSARLAGREVRSVRYAQNAPPIAVDPNGTYTCGQIYVHFVRLALPTRLPIVFINGGTFTGAMWETTPDGRAGWQSMFLQRGHDTYLTDSVGKGRSSYPPFPEIFPAPPAFRPEEETWSLLRIGERNASGMGAPFAGVQFPVSHFGEFAKQTVPRFPGQDEIELAAFSELFGRIGPCIVIAQSSGGYLAAQLVARGVGQIAAIVTVEMTAVPAFDGSDVAALCRVPQLVVWGDNIQASPMWRGTKTDVQAYADRINAAGGLVDMMDLPALGHTGNSHQIMMDRNSATVAGLIGHWLERFSLLRKEL